MVDIFEQETLSEEPVNSQDIFERSSNDPLVEKIKSNASLAKDFNPDTEAKAVRLSKEFNTPWSLMRGNEDKFEKAKSAPNPYTLVSNSPRTADYYKNFDATAVSYDDAPALQNVESVWDKLKRIPEKAVTSYNIGRRTVEGGKLYSEKIFDILSGSDSPELAGRITEFEAGAIKDTDDQNFVETGITAAAQMVPILADVLGSGQAEGLAYATAFGAGAIVAGQVPPLTVLPEEAITIPASSLIGYGAGVKMGAAKSMFLIEGGNALQEMLGITNENGEKIDQQVAALASIGVGAINAGLEFTGLKALSKVIPGGDKLVGQFSKEAIKAVIKKKTVQEALKSVLKKYAKGITTETVTEIGQEVVTILATEVAKDLSEGEFENAGLYDEVLPRLAETAKETVAATATLGLPFAGVKAGLDTKKAYNQQVFSEKFEAVKEAVEATKTKERSPEMTEVYLDNLELGEAYLSAEGVVELFQSSPEFAADILIRIGIDAAKAREAAASGNDVKTDLSKIHAYLTPEEQNQLKPDLKPAPSAMTERETDNIDVEKEAAKVGEQVQDYVEKQKSLQQVRTDLKKQIVSSGFKPQYADDAIALTEAFSDRMSLDGLDKEAFLKKISLRPVEGKKGETFFQKAKLYFQDKLGFYSSVLKSVDEMDFKTIPGKDLLNRLNKTSGVKKEELEWIGLPEFLELKPKVSKEEVQAFIENGGVKLEEVVKGSLPQTTKFEQYTLPGGEDYREVLLTLPEKEITKLYTSKDFEIVKGENGKFGVRLPNGEFNKNYKGEIFFHRASGFAADKAHDIKIKMNHDIKKSLNYKSSHYEEPNILAHTRLDDRIDSEGNKTLFIEEIQSDWHQEGRKSGYIDEESPLSKAEKERLFEYNKRVDSITDGQQFSDVFTQEEADDFKQLQDRSNIEAGSKPGVPSAPFKTTWPLLAFKRILRLAVEQGYDSVAWTPGEVQADRYDLSKQVDEIAYWFDDGESGGFIAMTIDGKDFEEQFSSPQELESKLGKEVAQKILNDEGIDGDERFGDGVKLLQNQDLKVGGEGMKTFYDKMLPSAVQKYIKKLDKSVKVGESTIGYIKGKYYLFSGSTELAGPFPTKDEAEGTNEELYGGSAEVTTYRDSEETIIEAGDDLVNVWSIPITDKLKQKVLEGQALFQEEKRGSVNITDDQYIISLFENKNYSTLLHELGHVYLNEYSVLAENSEEIKTEFDKVKTWLGVEKELTREHHEKFATAFERYLVEGKAPTRELKSAFRRFKNWLLSVYQKARNIGVELDDETRGIFDRMFTTRQDAFESGQANNMEMWTKEEMDSLAVLPDDRKYMSDLYKASIEKADEEITWRRNKARSESNAKWKEQAKREVDSKPEYVALASIKASKGLSAFSVRDTLGDSYLEYIKTRLGKEAINEKGGVDISEVSVLSGYARVEDMASAITRAEDIEAAYKTELAKKQASSDANYQVEDYLTDSKEWEEFMRLKSSYLLRAEGSPSQVAPTKAFKQFAKEQLGLEGVRDAIANKRYLANASKYSRIESNQLRSGKLNEASKASQIARLNFIKADLATKNREFFNKSIRGIKTLQKSKSITPDTSYQVQDLAARFGLAPLRKGEKINDALERTRSLVPEPDRVSVYDWAEDKIENGYEVQLPAFVLDGTVKDYRDLNWFEFEELKQAFDQIKTVDRQERYYTAFEKAQTMEEVREKLIGQLLESYKEKDISKRDESGIEKFLKGADAWTTKIETVLRMIDGGKIGGTWFQYFLKPLQAAENNEADRLRVIRKDLRKLFKKTDISDSMFKKIYTDGMPRSLTKAQVLAVALNQGNEGNKTKLKDGWAWNDDQVSAILDNLTKEDWDFVQGTWDYIDSFREESFNVAKEMTGKRPQRVDPSPVNTKFGQYKGGYYPLAYDPRKSLRTSMHVEAKDTKAMFQKSHSVANTKPGSHIERVALAGGQKPILDLGVIPDHIFDTVHDITHRNAIVNIAKLTRDKQVQDAMVKTIGIDLAKQFKDWLVDISNDQNKPSSPLHKFAAWARRGTTVVNMGMKMTTMVQQFLGATQSIDEIGVDFARGMNLFYGSGGLADLGKRGDWIREKSGFMRNRLLSFDRDIRDATKAITPMKKLRADAMKGMFLGIGLAQWYGVDAPTWMGSYNKYIRENQGKPLSELDDSAVDYADSVVRQTQGGGATKDLSKIQRGDELMRMFTMFYSYFNTLYNLGKLRISQTAKGQRPPVYAIASMALLWFIPATLSEVVSARGPEDDEEWGEWALPLVSMYPFQTVVGVRDISNAIGSGFGYQLTPAESSIKNLIWLSKDVWSAVSEGETEGLGEKALETSGYLAPIPSKQLSIWLFNGYDLLTGEDDELNYSDLLRRNRK